MFLFIISCHSDLESPPVLKQEFYQQDDLLWLWIFVKSDAFLALNLRNIFMALNLWEIWCFLRLWIFVKSDAFFGFESLINLLFMALNLWEIYFLWLWIFEKSSFYGFESLRNLLFMALILWEIYQSWSKLFSALRASSLLNLVAWNINDNQLWFTIIDHIVAHCCYLDFDDRHRNPNPNQSHILLGV